MAKISPTDPFNMALLWTCTACGFVWEGGQPHMECPSCEAYKTAFIDIPQHIEVAVREKLKKGQTPNCTSAREKRLTLMNEQGVTRRFRVKGRFLP